MTDPTTPRVELVVRIMPNGQVQVAGPLHDKGTCYAMLELARDTIHEHHAKMTRSPIVQASVLDPMLINPRANGAKGG
jgi:hypothetical protein